MTAPSADRASQTNYNFKRPATQTVIHCHDALRGKEAAQDISGDYVAWADTLFRKSSERVKSPAVK